MKTANASGIKNVKGKRNWLSNSTTANSIYYVEQESLLFVKISAAIVTIVLWKAQFTSCLLQLDTKIIIYLKRSVISFRSSFNSDQHSTRQRISECPTTIKQVWSEKKKTILVPNLISTINNVFYLYKIFL